jgi:hypothetical protein
MGKSPEFEYYVLAGALTATTFPQVWTNASSSALTSVWVSLHTADPETGQQGTSEVNYTGYTRISVTRSTAGWSVSTSAGTAKPVSTITFPMATSTSTMTASYAAIGLTSASTSGTIMYAGALSPTVAIAQNVIPRITTSSTISET